MTKLASGISAVLAILFVTGCKADKIVTIKSPAAEIFFTLETDFGHGAVSSDYTRVYAHLERNGKKDKIDVLDGDDLEIKKIVWLNPNEVTICLQGGFTTIFRNHVTLHVDNSLSNSLRTHLQEDETGECSEPSSK
jgi:hypothetical protein